MKLPIENLLNPNIQFTDPDTLQFCLPLSEKEWKSDLNYCGLTDTHGIAFVVKPKETKLFVSAILKHIV